MDNSKIFQNLVSKIEAGEHLDKAGATKLIELIITESKLTDQQISQLLTTISKHQPSIDEILGFINGMKKFMIQIHAPVRSIDTCGTGGDRSGSINVSTAAAILVSAGGVPVAKHGNRAATSKCGSADVLEELNIPINLDPIKAEVALKNQKFAFLFAPQYHPSLKRLSIIRKQLGFPTVFNLLGPLLNPANVKYQIIGTYNADNFNLLAEVLVKLKPIHAIVLTSTDGLDEASISADVQVAEIKNGSMEKYIINAKNYGLALTQDITIKGGTAFDNAKLITDSLMPNIKANAIRNTIVFNAGLAFYISGKKSSISEGITFANQLIDSGAAYKQLRLLQE